MGARANHIYTNLLVTDKMALSFLWSIEKNFCFLCLKVNRIFVLVVLNCMGFDFENYQSYNYY